VLGHAKGNRKTLMMTGYQRVTSPPRVAMGSLGKASKQNQMAFRIVLSIAGFFSPFFFFFFFGGEGVDRT
jgi:hypothetical protein